MKYTTKRWRYAVAAAAAVVLLPATAAMAKICPRDVANLSDQIHEPQLERRPHEPLDAIVGKTGGLDAAITEWERKLADAKDGRANLSQESASNVTRAFDELILILSQQLEGLLCRKAS